MTYRRRYYRRHRWTARDLVAPAAAALLLAGLVPTASHHHAAAPAAAAAVAAPAAAAASGPSARVAAQVIGFARSREGCPYVYGAAGPCDDGYDCSGLVMRAYESAGIPIDRTSEEQWATERHVRVPRPGDLVFFVGAAEDPPPGHVAIFIGPHEVIDAYATGWPVQEQSFDLPSSMEGMGAPMGYTDPAASS
jgi:cell wall-associated NlpC family hydrolase